MRTGARQTATQALPCFSDLRTLSEGNGGAMLSWEVDPQMKEQVLIAQLMKAPGMARDAFATLCELCRGRLHARICRLLAKDVRGLLDADDILQQAHAQAFQKLHTFRPHAQASF